MLVQRTDMNVNVEWHLHTVYLHFHLNPRVWKEG
jgi:hypothetical protein